LIRHPTNRGYGSAVKTGVKAAQHPFICITDSDGTYPNSCIPELLAYLMARDLDMVVGARTSPGVKIPIIRRPAKMLLRFLAKFLTGKQIPDLNSGLRVFRRTTFNLFLPLFPDGFSLTTTITMAMLTNDRSVAFVPISYFERVGRSKIRPIRDTANFIILILKMGLLFAPLKFFVTLSAICLTTAFAWAVFSRIFLGKLADVSTVIIAIAGLQVFVIGLLAELINIRVPSSYSRRADDE